MLFNSFEFIYVFVPVTLLGFFAIARFFRRDAAIAWLVAASFFYYGWWNPAYLALILFSIGFNFALGGQLGDMGRSRAARRRRLVIGVAGNLGLLGYYKYANFFVANVEAVSGAQFAWEPVVLPIAISFFTFQQIAYLVDAYRDEAHEYSFLHYMLFVTFFPQLVAGPIVHHKEMLPQFERESVLRLDAGHMAVGITMFFIGLFKKVVVADSLATYATPVFDAALAGHGVCFGEAWLGALAYTLQLYFDFSGYSDMAIGLARMFGIRLPLNFDSPYKSVNVIEFWRRWHMTLSRFLRDYVYIALGGNRKGSFRRYVNLMVTMVLGGLWHGAGWSFVIWGTLHGVFLVVNHGFRYLRVVLGLTGSGTATGRVAARALTFLVVVVAWVFFRAESLDSAAALTKTMLGGSGLGLAESWRFELGAFGDVLASAGVGFGGDAVLPLRTWSTGVPLIAAALAAVFGLPNSQEYVGLEGGPSRPEARETRPALRWQTSAAHLAVVLAIALLATGYLGSASEFLYYQF